MINITGNNVKVFKNVGMDNSGNERVWYNYSISNKISENSYEYMSKPIKFKRGEEPEESCNINIKEAFQSFYKKGEDKVDYLMVTNYEKIGEEKKEDNFDICLTDDDLPF